MAITGRRGISCLRGIIGLGSLRMRARRWAMRWRRWRGRPRTPALDQVRSANQAASNQPVRIKCHREFVLTALPRCWLAGQSWHAGHGVRWMAGDLSTKVNSPPTCGR
jgi:hypothetical protein